MPRAAKKARLDENIGAADAPKASETKPAPARRARAAPQSGKLDKFPTMPLNVMLEVFRHMEPLDLLHLARTSKALRAILMTRRHANVWKAACANVPGLPPCPDAVPVPLYASLLFCTFCHGCGKPNTRKILWDMKMRYCKVCTAELKYLGEEYRGSPTGPSIQDLIEPMELEEEFDECSAFSVLRVASPCADEKFFHTGKHLILDSEKSKLKLELLYMQEEERTLCVKRRIEANTSWRRLIPDLEKFCNIKSKPRDDQSPADKRKARYDSIVQKLKDLGWGEEVQSMTPLDECYLKRLPGVNEARLLTEKAWEKALPDLVDFMESLKSRRLASEKTRVFEARLQLFAEVLNESYHGGIGQPSALDIALGMPEVRAAIDVPVDVSLPKTAFAFLQHGPALAEFTARWRHAQAAALAAIVAAHTGPLDPATDPLSLAVARFACARCPAHAPYPQILAHRCPEYILARERVNTPDMYVRAALGALAACPRAAPQHVRLSHADETARVVRMCALDPARATVAAMNALPVRVGCRACSPVHGVAVMTWAGAVCHGHLVKCEAGGLYVVPEAQAAVARELERGILERAQQSLAARNAQDYVPPVYLLSDKWRENMFALSPDMVNALQNGSAAFFKLD